MADIRVQVPDEYMNALREKLALKTNAEVVQEALTLLNWAAEEKGRKRLILSTDQEGQQVERLAMRSLSILPVAKQEAKN